MKIRASIFIIITSAVLIVTGRTLAGATPLGTAFTYQGQLNLSGNPVNATADFQFTLFDAPAGPNQVGSMVPVNNVTIANGLFTAQVDFGLNVFNGEARWLQIAARSPAGGGSFTTLTPRQPLNSAPYALYALKSGAIDIADLPAGGAWTLTSNLNLDSSTLVVDPANNRVGIGISSPAAKLDIQASNGSNVLFGRRTGGGLAHNLYIDSAGNGSMQLIDSTGTPRVEFANGLTYFNYGDVGIGTTTPDGELKVSHGFDGEYLRYRFGILTINVDGDDTLMVFRVKDVGVGTITVSNGVVSYNGFMGSHYGWMDDEHSIDRGALIRMTGENRRLNDSAESDVVYGIERTASANDPACLGAYLGIMESDKPADLANPHLVAAVGNGEMLVVDSGTGDIQPGDYLISADVTGCAMKDDPNRFPVGHVVGRAAQAVDWESVSDTVAGRRRQRISVFFESFDRGSAADAEIASLRAEVAELRALVHQLTSSESEGSNQ